MTDTTATAEPHSDAEPSPDAGRPAEEQQQDSFDLFWRRLLHRWFVQYNPLYLLSAALVLGGTSLLSRGLTQHASAVAQLSVALVAEVYAVALILGAALLTRIGLRRPGVLLCLLAVVYQGDLTLHTETAAYLGAPGGMAAAFWLVVFGAKLGLLPWALRVHVARSAQAVAAYGALGLAVMPWLLMQLSVSQRGPVVSLWVFSVFATGLWTQRRIAGLGELDAWSHIVLRRTRVAIWAIWSTLLMFHVLFWSAEFQFSVGWLLPLPPLLATRYMRSELGVWATCGAILCLALTLWPLGASSTALMAALVLLLRALRQPRQVRAASTASAPGPYRTAGRPDESPPAVGLCFVSAPPPQLRRLLGGSLFAFYLSSWTVGWSGGALPEHSLYLDALLTMGVALLVWRVRARGVLLPLVLTYLHLATQAGLVGAPHGALQLGLWAVSIGFVLLLGSLALAYRLRPGVRGPPS